MDGAVEVWTDSYETMHMSGFTSYILWLHGQYLMFSVVMSYSGSSHAMHASYAVRDRLVKLYCNPHPNHKVTLITTEATGSPIIMQRKLSL
jgi:hypothetical protein